MHIALSPEIENYLQNKVSSGFYNNVSEAVRDAIYRMKEEDAKLSALQKAVRIGDEQLDNGAGIIYTSERLNAITQRAFTNALCGKKVNPNVIS